MSKSNILLTGGTGFFGRHMVSELKNHNYDIYILTRNKDNAKFIFQEDQSHVHFLDLHELDDILNNNGDFNFREIIHMATNYDRKDEDPLGVIETNILLPMRILKKLLQYNETIFINIDSYYVDNPYSEKLKNYIFSKIQISLYLKMISTKYDNTKILNIKLQHVFGKNDDRTKFTQWLKLQLQAGVPDINLTSGGQVRDFIYAPKAAKAILYILRNHHAYLANYNEIDLGTGIPVTIKEFVEKIKSLSKSKTRLKFGSLETSKFELSRSVANTENLIKSGFVVCADLDGDIKDWLNE